MKGRIERHIMCIIIVKAPGAEIPTEYLETSWVNNDDGGGFSFIDHDGQIVVRKGLMGWDEWLRWYEKDVAEHGNTSPFLIHFRIGTHGPNDEANTHPHVIHGRMVMAHNGIITRCHSKDSRSDTRVFIDDTLRFLPRGWLKNPGVVKLVEERIGSSKLVFLTTGSEYKNSVYIVNEHLGHWDKQGNWYSNSTYKQARKPATSATVTSSRPGQGWQGGRSYSGKGTGAKQGTKTPAPSQPITPSPRTCITDDEWVEIGGVMVPVTALREATVSATTERAYPHEVTRIDCQLCGTQVIWANEPWCWGCMWCVVEDCMVEWCECDGYKQLIGWDEWGPGYLDGHPATEPYDESDAYYKRLWEMTDEEVASVTE